jgi:hypothetical protein
MKKITIEEKYKEALKLLEEAQAMLRLYGPLTQTYSEMQCKVWEHENKWHDMMTRINRFRFAGDLYWENK